MTAGITKTRFFVSAEEKIAASSFKELFCLRDAHRVRNANDDVQVIKHHLNFVDLNAVFVRSLADATFRKVLIFVLPKHIVAIFRAPFNVPEIVSN